MASGVLALLGSGETAPGMTKVHRQLFSRLPAIAPVNLDTAYGFQLNVPQMSEKLEAYFDTSLHVHVTTLHFPSYESASDVERALFKRQVRQANYVFAGPGSPTYALNQWFPLHFDDDLLNVLGANGTLCFASAAALTLGAFTAPIYEVYKVGVERPRWQEGLNVLGHHGLNCVVIPHFDNNEGGNYDTRFCYLGEPRLLELERQLPEGVATLGVDEHTAAVLDFTQDTLTVMGRANAYWRLNGESRLLEKGSTTNLEDLRTTSPVESQLPPSTTPSSANASLVDLANQAAKGGDVGLEALAQLVLLANTGGEGFIDPTVLVKGVLDARVAARASGQYDIADQLRDALITAGVEVKDSPGGTTWSLATD
ncbi:MAG: Cysteinyl-tRNA synthetase-like protein [Acidimicrobiaceae bacterium]|nr:Cysteinyl-tRNA synthetase-like protein [Acidimicrobiaceae bacterium]